MSHNNNDKFEGCSSVLSSLWQFQQTSLFTDLSFCCIDGTVPAHKAMLVEMFKLLGVVGLAEADCLIVPGAMVADLEQALEHVYLKSDTEKLLNICFTTQVKSEHVDVLSLVVIKPEIPSDDECSVAARDVVFEDGGEMKQDMSEFEEYYNSELKTHNKNLSNPLNAKFPNRPKHVQRIESLKCNNCDHIAKNSERLKKHKSFHHENLKHQCDYCDFKTATNKDMKIHRDKVHPDWKVLKKLKKITCDQCDFVAKRPERLAGHIKREHGPKYLCDECEKTYLSPEKLEVHKNYAHDKTIRQCDQCSFQTNCKWSFKSHIRVKHSDEIFYCDQCDFNSHNKTNLRKHVEAKHEGRRFYCEQCEYSAPYNGGLLRHIKMVHEGVTYKCEFCDHKATTRSNLRLHADAKHLGVKYPCDLCEYQGSQPGSLKIHKQTRHPVSQNQHNEMSGVYE